MKFRTWIFAQKLLAVSLCPALLIHAARTIRPSVIAVHRALDSGTAPSPPSQSKRAVTARPSPEGSNPPRIEFFVGYSHFQGVPTFKTGNRMVGLNGGNLTVALNLNRHLGLVGDFGGYGDSQLRLTGAEGTPPRVTAANGSVYTFLCGPRLSYRRYSRIAPFAQVLLGGIHASSVTLSGCRGSLCTPLPTQNSFSLVAGGGLYIGVLRHLSIRAIQAEYMMTRFGLLTPEGSTTQSDLRLSSGLVLRFGVSSQH
jgi:hypothetical protein